MKLIVGLGNPGKKYEKTRHNLGFLVVENFLKDFGTAGKVSWENNEKFKSEIAKIEWQPKHGKLEKVILAKPLTYMNNSGIAVSNILKFFKIDPSDLWVIHDDIDLRLGTMRIRFGGSSAGQKGVESIMEALGTDKFWRFRMGIGEDLANSGYNSNAKKTKIRDVENFVLGKFSGHELGKVKELLRRGVKAIETGLEDGLERSMNEFNTR